MITVSGLAIPGVYVIYRADDPVYVGQSSDVHARVGQHRRCRTMPPFDRVDYERVEGVQARRKREAELIAIHRPPRNIPVGRKPGLTYGRVEGWNPEAFSRARVAADLTFDALADRLGVSRTQVFTWSQDRRPPLALFSELARALRVRQKDLVR